MSMVRVISLQHSSVLCGSAQRCLVLDYEYGESYKNISLQDFSCFVQFQTTSMVKAISVQDLSCFVQFQTPSMVKAISLQDLSCFVQFQTTSMVRAVSLQQSSVLCSSVQLHSVIDYHYQYGESSIFLTLFSCFVQFQSKVFCIAVDKEVFCVAAGIEVCFVLQWILSYVLCGGGH